MAPHIPISRCHTLTYDTSLYYNLLHDSPLHADLSLTQKRGHPTRFPDEADEDHRREHHLPGRWAEPLRRLGRHARRIRGPSLPLRLQGVRPLLSVRASAAAPHGPRTLRGADGPAGPGEGPEDPRLRPGR